jgi:glycosyltransferase involved in cell wall biosynthesis
VRLLFVGDGPEHSRAEELCAELGVSDAVVSLGAQECIEEIYPLADVMLLPSEHESFGLVALEAMCAGVVVVATSEGGTREVIRHGVSGYLHAPHDVEGMVATISALFDDPKRMEPIREEARRVAEEDFPIDRAVERYLALYERALR